MVFKMHADMHTPVVDILDWELYKYAVQTSFDVQIHDLFPFLTFLY